MDETFVGYRQNSNQRIAIILGFQIQSRSKSKLQISVLLSIINKKFSTFEQ